MESRGQFRRSTARAGFDVYRTRKLVSLLVTIALSATAVACGGSTSSAPSPTPVAPTPTPIPSAPIEPTVVILPSGVSPPEITVAVGDRVTFINNDVQPHDTAGGPDPATRDCPEIDAVGFLLPGQSRQTAPMRAARICDYHDHSNHAAIFNGRIIIR
jgi:plastocyanin